MPNNPDLEREGFLVWHPEVHEHFHERLYFFLLALKPYREEAFREKLKQLLAEFGVAVEVGKEGYCSYEVLGEFDHLLRIWLPVQSDVKFVARARELLPNLKSILQFHVHKVVSDWRFAKRPDPGFVRRLKAERVRQWQQATSLAGCQEPIDAGGARWIERESGARPIQGQAAGKEASFDSIKAFISLQPPGNADDAQREFIEKEVVQRINESEGMRDCTFYSGVGFTWLLAKVVTNSFRHLADLISKIGTVYGGFGVSTSTYAAIRCRAEGDRIGDKSMIEEKKLPAEVEEFLPALAGETDEQKQREVEIFVRRRIIPQQLSEEESKAVRELMEAILSLDEGAAAMALYRPTVQTERMIRDKLNPLLGRYYSDDMKKLGDFFRERNLDFKNLGTLPLGSVLLATREHVLKILPNRSISEECSEENLRLLAKIRNLLMHGAELNLARDWQNLAGYLLSLMRVRREFEDALNESLQKLSPPAQ